MEGVALLLRDAAEVEIRIAAAWRGHDGDVSVMWVGVALRDPFQRVQGTGALVEVLTAEAGVWRGGGVSGLRGLGGALDGDGGLGREADEFVADAGGEAFEEVGDAEAEVDVVDNACAEGFDCAVEEVEGGADFVLFGA